MPLQVVFGGQIVAETVWSLRVLETSHPPSYYCPREDNLTDFLKPSQVSSHCEWKGQARFYDLALGKHRCQAASWSYPEPAARYAALEGMVAFYPPRVDACFIAGEKVRAQEGGFNGGWITSGIVGPFKGGEGSGGW